MALLAYIAMWELFTSYPCMYTNSVIVGAARVDLLPDMYLHLHDVLQYLHLLMTFRDGVQVLSINQKVSFEFLGTNYTFGVVNVLVEGQREGDVRLQGALTPDTHWQFETASNSGIKVSYCS